MIGDRAQELARLYAEHARHEQGPRTDGHRLSPSSRLDDEIIDKARAEIGGKLDRLWRGDTSDYGHDHSAADDGFVHKLWSYTQDAEQIRRIHAMSELHRPEKSGRRADYLRRSIDRARNNVTWYYDWPDASQTGQRRTGVTGVRPTFGPKPATWPVLADEAFYGLAGDIVGCIEPHTEADSVAVLANLLSAFGSAIGRGAFLRIGADLHHLKLNVGLVGETAKGRKGMSWGYVRELMSEADPAWTGNRVLNGLSSGEGLIYAVRDRLETENKKGEIVVEDEGVRDKRLLILEPELAGVLKVMARDGSTLSPVIRQAWDEGRLQTLTKNSPMSATDAHVSIVGHITKAELLRYLSATEAANGFANRFIWLLVRRSRVLPFGGEWWNVDTAPLLRRLSSALEFAAAPAEIAWGDTAREIWREVYGPLSEGKPGLFGAVVSRAEAQVVRLASVYAVMDESHEIERGHLLAALALWEYAEESARYIFGDATGDPVADRALEALRAAGNKGMTKTEISNMFGRNQSADRINQALALLLRGDRVRREIQETGGRRAERWFAT